MKKIGKTILSFLLCLSLTTTDFLIHPNDTDEFAVVRETLANYNELYGLDDLVTPQVKLERKASTQNLKYLAVFIEFADSDELTANHLDDPQSIQNAETLLNSEELFEMESINGPIKVPSFKKYYQMQSYGKLNVTTEIFPKENGQVVSYKDSHPMAYYLKHSDSNPLGYKDSIESLKRETELVDSAIAYIANQMTIYGISADEIDTGSDGIVDAISFFIEGRDVLESSIGWGDLLWSHKLDNLNLTSTILGKRVVSYNLLYTYDYTETAGLFSLKKGTYGTIIHEFGHTLGLIDLYRFDRTGGNPVGFYDIMGQSSGSNPANLLTYFTSEYGPETNWHKPMPTINETTENITLKKPEYSDDSEPRAIKLEVSPTSDEFFVVEYHEKQNTYSTHSAESSGLIVYRVNEKNKYSGNKEGGDHGELDHIFVFRPNEPSLGAGKGDLTLATLNMKRPTLGLEIDSTSEFDNRTIYYANGANSGITIQVTSETSDSITFDVTFPSLEGTGTEEDPYLISTPEMFLHALSNDTTGKYFRLIADLDFQNIANYPAIEFRGNLDGNGKTLKNITSQTGVFAELGGHFTPSIVENILVENLIVSSPKGSYLGGFASIVNNVTIRNVHLLSGSVTNSENDTENTLDSTGGFAGNVSNNTTIENCSSHLLVTAPKNVGGFIGVNLNATIKNCFTDGEVRGSSTLGAFIGLQCIMDDSYHVPSLVLYRESSLPAIGGYATPLHREDVLPPSELSKGLVSVSIQESLTIEEGQTQDFVPTTNPPIDLIDDVRSKNSSIASYSDQKVFGIAPGSTTLVTTIRIGTHPIEIETAITVRKGEGPLSEQQVLNYFGLSKKDGYVSGFTLGDSVENVKRNLSSHPDVTLKDFHDSQNRDVSTGLIATGMTFTLFFDATEYHYTVVIKGDASGDGLIYATDYVLIKKHIMGKKTLSGAYFYASDIDGDGNIFATDYVKIRNHIMGRSQIEQN